MTLCRPAPLPVVAFHALLRRLCVPALLGVLAIATQAAAQPVRLLTFDAPPFASKSGVAVGQPGIYVEIMQALLKELGLTSEVEFVGNAEGQQIAREQANVVFFPLARNAAREDQYQWLGSVMDQELGFVTLADKGPVSSLDEGRKLRRLGAIEGSSALRYIESRGFDNIVRGNANDLVRMLVRGEIDGYFSGFLILRRVAQEQGLSTRFAFGHVAVVGKPWFAAGKNAPAIDLARWQASLARLEADGTVARIRKSYLGE